MNLVSNSSIQNIRVSVTTSPNGRDSSKTAETEFQFPASLADSNSSTDESYSTMISNFVSENLAKTSKFDDDSTFDHRPLLDLISQLNRRHTLNESPLPIESTSNEILPPKLLSPFRPMIVHKKQQVKDFLFFISNIYLVFQRNQLVHWKSLNLLRYFLDEIVEHQSYVVIRSIVQI